MTAKELFWNKATDLVENKEAVGRNRRNKATVCARHWGSENGTTTHCGPLSHVDDRSEPHDSSVKHSVYTRLRVGFKAKVQACLRPRLEVKVESRRVDTTVLVSRNKLRAMEAEPARKADDANQLRPTCWWCVRVGSCRAHAPHLAAGAGTYQLPSISLPSGRCARPPPAR